MNSFLRQATASQSRAIGPFLDDTDGKTPETGLTIANTDIKLVANGAASADKNSGGGTHRVNGVYGVTWDATDSATVGELEGSVVVAGALPVFFTYTVLEEAVYDALFAASALGYVANAPVNLAQISGDSTAADNLENAFDDTAGPVPWTGIVDQGTAQAATGTTLQLRSAAAFADDTLNGMIVGALGSTQGYWQFRVITDYVGATDTATVDTWTVTPSGTVTYKVFGSATSATENAGLVDDVWNEALSGHTTAGTSGKGVSDSATQTTAGAIRADIGMASADLDTQLTALTTAVSTVNTNVTGTPAAVLAAAVVAPIFSDMRQANGTEVQGDGTTGDKWRSALIP